MIADIDCRLIEAGHVAEVAAALGQVFSQNEPLAIAAGQTSKEATQLAALLGAKGARERLSFAAYDRSGDVLAGAALVHDFGTPSPDGFPEVGAGSGAIIGFLDTLEVNYRRSRVMAPGIYAHIFMLGVLPQWSGRGLAGRLVENVLANAKDRGYRVAFTEATSLGSQRVFQRAGFQDVDEALYASFELNGHRPFARIEAPRSALLMERVL